MPNNLREFVINLLEQNLPQHYCYHSCAHTLYVADKALEIGRYEGCSPAELRLLETAALMHDTGCITVFNGHELESCRLAAQHLPEFGFSKEEVTKVQGMIMATRVPQTPTNKLEEIVADADLEYLGTQQAATLAGKLFQELSVMNPNLDEKTWNKIEIAFLENHHYFTAYCKQHSEPAKQQYLRLIKSKFT